MSWPFLAPVSRWNASRLSVSDKLSLANTTPRDQRAIFSGFVSSMRGNALGQKIVAAHAALGDEDLELYYSPDNCGSFQMFYWVWSHLDLCY